MSVDFIFYVRPGDPYDRREHPDAHEVMGPHAQVGVYKTHHAADMVAAALNQWAGSQIR